MAAGRTPACKRAWRTAKRHGAHARGADRGCRAWCRRRRRPGGTPALCQSIVLFRTSLAGSRLASERPCRRTLEPGGGRYFVYRPPHGQPRAVRCASRPDTDGSQSNGALPRAPSSSQQRCLAGLRRTPGFSWISNASQPVSVSMDAHLRINGSCSTDVLSTLSRIVSTDGMA